MASPVFVCSMFSMFVATMLLMLAITIIELIELLVAILELAIGGAARRVLLYSDTMVLWYLLYLLVGGTEGTLP